MHSDLIKSEDNAETTSVSSATADSPALAGHGLALTADGVLTWASGTLHCPRNWPSARRTANTALVLWFEFFTTVIATAGPAAAHYARQSTFANTSPEGLLAAFAFSYPLGQAIGSLIIPPLSESMGRKPYYLASCTALAITYLLSGVTPSLAGVVIGRLLGGFASAVPSVVVAGSIEDLYDARQRVWLVWVWNCFTILSQVLGPVYAAWVGKALFWPWIYYVPAIAAGATLPLFALMDETRHSTVMRRCIARARQAGLSISSDTRWTLDRDSRLSLSSVITRPAHLLFTEPLVFTTTLLCAFCMGLIYLFSEALGHVYTDTGFGFSYANASLPFLALAAGVPFSLLPRFADARRYHSSQTEAEPEAKLTGFALGVPALAVGLWVFAWTIPPLATGVHWLASCAGLLLVGFAATEVSYTLQGYLADAYTAYAASALSALACVRALLAAAMPLFGTQMFEGLGNNGAASLLAGLATLFLAAPWFVLRYGRTLRLRSQFIGKVEEAGFS